MSSTTAQQQEQRFTATVAASSGGRVYVAIPFDPNDVWGEKYQHFVSGAIDGHWVRGVLDYEEDTGFILPLGAAWRSDNEGVEEGAEVEVVLKPHGLLPEDLAADIAAALEADPQARTFFASVAPFYRRNYIRWIESAKRPETRAARIAETVKSLREGRKRQ